QVRAKPQAKPSRERQRRAELRRQQSLAHQYRWGNLESDESRRLALGVHRGRHFGAMLNEAGGDVALATPWDELETCRQGALELAQISLRFDEDHCLRLSSQ